MDTALTGKSIPLNPGSEKRRLVRASVGKGEKAPLSSGAEMLRRVAPLYAKSAQQPAANSGGTADKKKFLFALSRFKPVRGVFYFLQAYCLAAGWCHCEAFWIGQVCVEINKRRGNLVEIRAILSFWNGMKWSARALWATLRALRV